MPNEPTRISNLQPRERALRLLLAAILLVLGWAGSGGLWSVLARVSALYPLLVAALGWSPARALWRLVHTSERSPRS